MTDRSPSPRRAIRFGVFELDLHAAELRKAGARLSLPAQSFEVLSLLLERPGDLVTREELRQRLWPNGTFVDFDHSLNAVVNRLRDTLGDSADRPRFIETVPRRGYRFVGAVEAASAAAPVTPQTITTGRPTRVARYVRQLWATHQERSDHCGSARARGWGVAVLASAPSGCATAQGRAPHGAGWHRGLAGVLSGRPTVAFGWDGEKHDNPDIYVTLVGSRSVRRVTTHPGDDYAPSWSPDGLHIAFLRQAAGVARIHVTSALGGSDRKVSDFPVPGKVPFSPVASQIAWSPDGQYIVAGRDPRASATMSPGIYLVPLQGGEPRALTRPERPAFDFSPAFSPDARRMAYASCGKFDALTPVYYPMNCQMRIVNMDGAVLPLGARPHIDRATRRPTRPRVGS